jgi:hypothetical protein
VELLRPSAPSGEEAILTRRRRSRILGPTFALPRAIPDDSDYRKHVPLNFRLDAKKIVGEVAQDLSSKGKSADFWVELSHAGLTAAEIFAETSTLVGALAIAGPLLGLVSAGLASGTGYREVGERIATDWSATGFARGVVTGADRRPASQVKDYFGNDYVPPNPQFPRGRLIAMGNYKMANRKITLTQSDCRGVLTLSFRSKACCMSLTNTRHSSQKFAMPSFWP